MLLHFCLQSSEWESDRYKQPDQWLHKLPLWLKNMSFHSLDKIRDIIDMFVCNLSTGTFYAWECQIWIAVKMTSFSRLANFFTAVLLMPSQMTSSWNFDFSCSYAMASHWWIMQMFCFGMFPRLPAFMQQCK